MHEAELVDHYKKLHAEMMAHLDWMKSGRVTLHETGSDGAKEDITKREIEAYRRRVDGLGEVIEAHEKRIRGG